MQVRRTHARLVLAGYCCLALAIPFLTPATPERDEFPPIAPLVLAGIPDDDAMMEPLRRQAMIALADLQSARLRGLQVSNAEQIRVTACAGSC
jgi:hypothetical protein